MEYDEFKIQLGNPEELNKIEGSEAFIQFCFAALFDANDPAAQFLAMAAAHSFCRKNYVRGTQISNRSARIRYPKKQIQTNQPTQKMRM